MALYGCNERVRCSVRPGGNERLANLYVARLKEAKEGRVPLAVITSSPTRRMGRVAQAHRGSQHAFAAKARDEQRGSP